MINKHAQITETEAKQLHARPMLQTEYIAPRNEIERTIATIWGHVLGIDRIGVEDDFFKIGGHSLLATQLISRLNIAFNIKLPLRLVFEKYTVSQQAISIIQKIAETMEPFQLSKILEELD
jgi:acyl carrier protein